MVDDERSERARSFGAVAEDYDRYRPGYPDALYADLRDLAGPAPRVLEAGAGTGRATLGLARRGATVTAVEPDPEMAAVLRRRAAGLAVTVEETPFEEHDAAPGEADLVVSAQAWHWVDPAAGAAVAARALGEGGVLALWWNRPDDFDGPVWAALEEAYDRHAPELARSAVTAQNAHSVIEDRVLETAPGFTPWTERWHRWVEHYDAARYCAMLRTHSDHIRLPGAQRERLLAAVGEAIDRAGDGVLTYRYRTVLVWARRRL